MLGRLSNNLYWYCDNCIPHTMNGLVRSFLDCADLLDELRTILPILRTIAAANNTTTAPSHHNIEMMIVDSGPLSTYVLSSQASGIAITSTAVAPPTNTYVQGSANQISLAAYVISSQGDVNISPANTNKRKLDSEHADDDRSSKCPRLLAQSVVSTGQEGNNDRGQMQISGRRI